MGGACVIAVKAKVGASADESPDVYAPEYATEIRSLALRTSEYTELRDAWEAIMEQHWNQPRQAMMRAEARRRSRDGSGDESEGRDDLEDMIREKRREEAKRRVRKQLKKQRRGSKAGRRGSNASVASAASIEDPESPTAQKVETPKPKRLKLRWFLDHCKMDRTPFAVRAFAVMDLDALGSIDFRQYLKGVWNIASFSQSALEVYLFGIYDLDGRGYIEVEELPAILKEVYGDSNKKKERLHKELLSYARDISLKMDKLRILTPTLFVELNRRMPSFLMPAFRFQTYLREAICGPGFWMKAEQRREYRLQHSKARYTAAMKDIGLTREGFCEKGGSWIQGDMAKLVTPEQRANSLVRYVLHIGEDLQGLTHGKVTVAHDAPDSDDGSRSSGGGRRRSTNRQAVTISHLLGQERLSVAAAAQADGKNIESVLKQAQRAKEQEGSFVRGRKPAPRGGRRRSEPEPSHAHLLDGSDGSGDESGGDDSVIGGAGGPATAGAARAARLRAKRRTAGVRRNRFQGRGRSKSQADASADAGAAAAVVAAKGGRTRSGSTSSVTRQKKQAAPRPRSASQAARAAPKQTEGMTMEERMFHTQVAMKGRSTVAEVPARRKSKAQPRRRKSYT